MKNPISQNVVWTIEQIAVFIAEAGNKSTKQRSIYYKASLFLSASVVEALVFLIIKNFCISSSEIEHRKEYKYKYIHAFPKNILKDTGRNIGIYDKIPVEFEWKDDIDFMSMNEIGFKYGIFNKRLYQKLEGIRKKRNRIHIQSLDEKDHRYTKRDVEYVSSAVPPLLDIMQK